MKILYDIFFVLFGVFYVPGLLLKGKLHRRFSERLGFLPSDLKKFKRPVWIHAVSVGEAAVAVRLAGSIKEKYPDIPVVVSTTTRTGNDMVKRSAKGAVDASFYYPLDISGIVRKAIRHINPGLYIMIETELWPNMLEALRSSCIPVALVNGRISDTSFRNYLRIRFITRRLFNCIDTVCAQTESDASRISSLGAASEGVFVCGNIKFDTDAVLSGKDGIDKQSLGFKREDRVIVAGSTHFPEENMIADMFVNLRTKFPDLKLVVAPRHIERKEAVRIYLEKALLKSVFFSDIVRKDKTDPVEADAVIVDTIGHLKDIYAAATIVFIGGSISKKGGQNPIEAALWGRSVIFGPDMSNFREISRIFLDNQAALRVKDAFELETAVTGLLNDPQRRAILAENALAVIKENSGAVQKTMAALEKYLPARGL